MTHAYLRGAIGNNESSLVLMLKLILKPILTTDIVLRKLYFPAPTPPPLRPAKSHASPIFRQKKAVRAKAGTAFRHHLKITVAQLQSPLQTLQPSSTASGGRDHRFPIP